MAVKIILREAVENLGERGETVSVASGYARNYLLPKRLALLATPGNLKQIEHKRRVWAVRDQEELGEAEQLAARLGQVELAITKKAGESGTLYGSVTKAEIHAALVAQGFDVDRRKIVQDEPIKTLGAHEIPVRIHRNVTALFKLEVVAEETAE